MGSAIGIPELLTAEQCQDLAGVHWDPRLFDIHKNEDGLVPCQYYIEEMRHHVRLQTKYCEVVEGHDKEFWEPLLTSQYYNILFDVESGAYAPYDSGCDNKRRSLFLDALKRCFMSSARLFCEKGCKELFAIGSLCASAGLKQTGGNDCTKLWSDLKTAGRWFYVVVYATVFGSI